MNLQLIQTGWGWSAAAWQEGLLAGVTLPHDNPQQAVTTLAGYLKLSEAAITQAAEAAANEPWQRLAQALANYFAGQRVVFDLPLFWSGLTAFQQRVLKEVKEIPYGQTVSYGEIARRIGCPKGARAVGGAVAANPWPPVVPCHRVLAADGRLGGFSYGLTWKEKLLQLENIPYQTGR
ncbi:methylated-DNA--[protein]-cysteine S-methyltransferase [Desulforamulus hydrothermalis]|uniref:methylated-DNA--[protein]-cysteine S-methyltransferase n=1 Tax=Desulforamulus hydrothermalis Lam5 = DSM 18033 TaxID=1121428 RepID=K8EHJ4_9FIRM|nr:methylated-DNA--[protein]-cysteine S-methyltransferase [Desulforamulus hydrothermalis]CCO08111.1 Methylated-DNA/protein-cysteine methyltransferase [Desulforamulus hydrothermalis Lam5 = DSM 18033]SHG81769.1 methylated-DNA-[protein]-cysteine S-methyltransferase [Desulforamulus hydrothermalis Lam5 = DSM 18033]